MRKIDFIASEVHFFDHICEIWKALPVECKGVFYVPVQIRDYAKGKGVQTELLCEGFKDSRLCLVASWGNYRDFTCGEVVFMEHGIGHVYGDKHPSYAGGLGKDRVVLFLNQHELSLRRNKESYPDVRGEIIGTPKMDLYQNVEIRHGNRVCLSFHWDCFVSPESRSAFEYYRKYIYALRRVKGIELVMHGHPRQYGAWQKKIKQYGVPFIEDFDEVLRECDVYVNDNSSTMYEFASLGKPIVILNCPHYRRTVRTGIRFWEYLCGVQVNYPHELNKTVLRAVNEPDEFKNERDLMRKELYPYFGVSSLRARDVLVDFLSE